jgi:hypothetical protein
MLAAGRFVADLLLVADANGIFRIEPNDADAMSQSLKVPSLKIASLAEMCFSS